LVLELKPILISEEEIRALLTSIDEASIREARKTCLTSLEETILTKGEPGGAAVYDLKGR
jgi:hypothetical protein